MDSAGKLSTEKWYSAPLLWKKLVRVARFAGEKLVLTALTLFYCLQDKDTPAWAKGIILGALGYFILPTDTVPDMIPGVGLADDWTALVSALGTVAAYIKDEHKEKARSKTAGIFGETKPPAPPEFSGY